MNTVPELDKDISMIMKDRTMKGYGLVFCISLSHIEMNLSYMYTRQAKMYINVIQTITGKN